MNNHTIIYQDTNEVKKYIDSDIIITCIGTLFYSLCNLFQIDINYIIQNRYHTMLFNLILFFCSLVSIIKTMIY